jgi:hypothetical protein
MATNHNDAINVSREERVEVLLLAVWIIVSVAQEDRKAGRCQRIFDTGEQRNDSFPKSAQDQTHGEGAPPDQTLRQAIGPKPQLLRHKPNALARFRAEITFPIQRFRARADRDACDARDIVDRRNNASQLLPSGRLFGGWCAHRTWSLTLHL